MQIRRCPVTLHASDNNKAVNTEDDGVVVMFMVLCYCAAVMLDLALERGPSLIKNDQRRSPDDEKIEDARKARAEKRLNCFCVTVK